MTLVLLLVLAFAAGMAFMWYVAGRLLYIAFNRSLVYARALSRIDYETLLRAKTQVDREVAKRQPKADQSVKP